MPMKILLAYKGLGTMGTFQRFVSLVGVLHVFGQTYFSVKSSIANRTNIFAFASVMKHVGPQLSSLNEPFATFITFMRLIIRVGLSVAIQGLLGCKCGCALKKGEINKIPSISRDFHKLPHYTRMVFRLYAYDGAYAMPR